MRPDPQHTRSAAFVFAWNENKFRSQEHIRADPSENRVGESPFFALPGLRQLVLG